MPDSLPKRPDPWALEAARLPLAFAQVREDPRLDAAIVDTLSAPATVVMIASGGETLVQLARHPKVGRIHAVDMNPAQLALTQVKGELATIDPGECCRLLGHEPMDPDKRATRLAELMDVLGLASGVFGPRETTAIHGLDHAGRYERCFAELRAELGSSGPVEARAKMDGALARVMSLENLVALFGELATQNPAQPFHAHFAARLRLALERQDAAENPFLWQMLRGVFPPGHRYDWLRSPGPLTAEILTHCGFMRSVLDGLPAASADLVHLSNILDWLSGEEAAATLEAAARVLRPGGWIILRQLNSSLDFPALGHGLAWHDALGRDMEKRDRSFFYPRIHLATRL